jgi:Ca2+-binding RTX toxin-like protein
MAAVVLLTSSLAIAAGGAGPGGAKPLPVTSGRCGGIEPTILGTVGDDRLVGTPGGDVIVAGDGDDRVQGGGGADVICGGGGSDRVDGGPGEDTIAGGPGQDSLHGGADSDTIGGGRGQDNVYGGAGTDRIYGGLGDDILSPGRGRDAIFGGPGADRILPGDGSSLIVPDPAAPDHVASDLELPAPEIKVRDPGDPSYLLGADITLPDESAEQLLGPFDADPNEFDPPQRWADVVNPGRGDDTVTASPGSDRVIGSPGNDTIAGGGGQDRVEGGEGNDTLDGGPGADVIGGGEGNDKIDTGPGTGTGIVELGDVVDAGEGDDTVTGGPDADAISGGAGADAIYSGEARDHVDGGDGGDRITAGGGDDAVRAGTGSDVVDAGAGRDTVDSGDGDDEVDGGPDRDVIAGGPGADRLSGGRGGDSIVAGPDDGADGADTVDGGDSVDDISGGGGDDTLQGGADPDTIFGQSGDDRIESDAGYDSAYGNDGNDTCIDAEQSFLCEQRMGTADNTLVQDAPVPGGGVCDAWASPTGDDQAPGDADHPYRTAERLVNALRAGQTGCLKGGATFEEPDFELHARGGGEAGQPVTLRTEPAAELATIRGRVWVDQSAHDISFEGLRFDGQNPLAELRGAGAALPSPTVDGDRITFFGDDVTTTSTATCFVLGSVTGFGIAEDISITGSRIHDCGVPAPPDQPSGDHGVDLEASRNAVVADNYIYDNADKGVLVYPDAQGSVIRDNVLDRNRIDLHFGTAVSPGGDWIYPAGTRVMPEDNAVSNNVITNSQLGLSDPFHWQVEGSKDWTGSPDPAGNLVDGNCFWHQDPSRDIQQPNVVFTEGTKNLAGPPAAGPPQPTAGPGYLNEADKDFRLDGAPEHCPRSVGPEDPPEVTTTGILNESAEGRFEVPPGFTVTDHSRTSGSTVWVEFRNSSGPRTWNSEPVTVAPGESASGIVSVPPGMVPVAYRAVARSASGFAYGQPGPAVGQVVEPEQTGPVRTPDPVLGRTALLAAPSRAVAARLIGLDSFYRFRRFAHVPLGTEVDATRGRLDIETIGRDGKRGIATVHGGVFTVHQHHAIDDPTTLQLSKRARCARGKGATASRRRGINRLYAHWRHRRHRRFTIRGHYASGSARGTRFWVEDRCAGTLVAVQEGSVLVEDFARHRTLVVRAGHHYLARSRRRGGG